MRMQVQEREYMAVSPTRQRLGFGFGFGLAAALFHFVLGGHGERVPRDLRVAKFDTCRRHRRR